MSKNSTLQSYAKKTFLAVGGNESWTRNPNLIPNKLKRITPLIEILWRFSWKVGQHHVKVFCFGENIRILKSYEFLYHKDLCVGEDGWTVSELIEAVGV